MESQPTTESASRIPKGMRAGVREFREASLTVSVPTSIPEHMRERMRERTREITHVFVTPSARGKRLATALMNFVCQEADANRITLILTARDYDEGGPNETALVAWYQKFGFKTLQDTPTGTFMARQVHEKPRIKPVSLAVAKAMSKVLH